MPRVQKTLKFPERGKPGEPYTFTVLTLPTKAYEEIRKILRATGFEDRIVLTDDNETLDLHNLAFQEDCGVCPFCHAVLTRCPHCSTRWCHRHDPLGMETICHECKRRTA